MKAIVTGGGGFAGSYLVEALLVGGHEVVSVGNNAAPAGQEDFYTQIDLLDKDAVNKTLSFKDVDCIFHLAGLTNVGESFKKPADYMNVNGEIQINLSESCLAQKANPRFLVISSAHVYDPKSPMPLTEKSPTLPSSPYAASKLEQELLAQYYNLRGLEAVVARAFNHIGPRQLPGFLVPDLAKQIAEAEAKGLPTITVGNLDAKRDFTDVRDIAAAYIALAEKGKAGETYNVCSGQALSGHQILETLLKDSKARITTEPNPELMRPADIAELYGDNSKIKTDTGWSAKIPIEQTLADVLEYWRKEAS